MIEGKVISIKGQIIEVEFPDQKPNIYDLLVMKDAPETKMEVYTSSIDNSPEPPTITVNVAASESVLLSGSLAVNVIVSEPVHDELGVVIVATLEPEMLTLNCVFPEYVHVIWLSLWSASVT